MSHINSRPFFLMLLVCLADSAAAGGTSTSGKSPEAPGVGERLDQFLKNAERQPEEVAEQLFVPPLPDAATTDEGTKAEYQKALRSYYEYRQSGYQHRKAVFAWQLLSSKIIFAVVVLLVLIGVYFSWIQLTGRTYRHPSASKLQKLGTQQGKPANNTQSVETPTAEDSALKAPPDSGAMKFKAALDGIEVSSPVLGVVILVISIVFFYLYLVVVYPIHDAF
ncbi:DUF4158 domain-containing protein [Corallococcus carmarthensis]|uniref:DUF4158 domain-containing protein n=1 Tax=Corallococcus carmarthensis TaxID=2316728 RepID=UPI0011C368EF|nr:DUF4158 domain-containing protein [Corallococcus carmarthensis]